MSLSLSLNVIAAHYPAGTKVAAISVRGRSKSLKTHHHPHAATVGASGSPSSPKLSADNKLIMAQFAAQQQAISGHEILQNIPSLHDSEWLRSSIPKMKEQLKQKEGIKEMLLEELTSFYRLKITFLSNATHFPRFKQFFENNKRSKKHRIVVRHELWIGDLLYEDTTFDSDITAKMGEMMRFDPHSFLQSKLKLSDMARESCLSLTVYLCKLKGHHPATTTADGGGDGVGSHSAVKDDAFEMMLPLAFARFPMIDERNLLRDGKYTLHLWPLPIYLAEVHCVGLFG